MYIELSPLQKDMPPPPPPPPHTHPSSLLRRKGDGPLGALCIIFDEEGDDGMTGDIEEEEQEERSLPIRKIRGPILSIEKEEAEPGGRCIMV